MGTSPTAVPPPTRQEIHRKLSVSSSSLSSSTRQMARKGSLPLPPPGPQQEGSPYGQQQAPSLDRQLSSPIAVPSASLPASNIPLQHYQQPSSVSSSNLSSSPPYSHLSTSQNLSAISEQGARSTTNGGGTTVFSDSEIDMLEAEIDYEGEDEEDEDGSEVGLEGEGGEGGDIRRKVEGERVLKSGYLDKKGEKRKSWKKRWFVLRTEKLSYYKTDREYKLLRLIDLHDIHSVALVLLKKHTTAFAIVTKLRTYYVKAHASTEADSWVDAINLARREVKEREEARDHRSAGSAGGGMPPAMSRRGTNSLAQQRQQQDLAQQQYQDRQRQGSISPSLSASSAGGSHAQPSLFSPSSVTSAGAPISSPPSMAALRINPFFQDPSAQYHQQPPPHVRNQTASPTDIRPPSSSFQPSSPTRGGQSQPNNTGATSSSEDEDDDERHPPVMSPSAMERRPSGEILAAVGGGEVAKPVIVRDPNKVIMSGYLMKMGKRKHWRKRWFVLTSGSLVYTSSHMDTKPHRVIPLSRILDALEYEPAPKEPSSLANPALRLTRSDKSHASLTSSAAATSPSVHESSGTPFVLNSPDLSSTAASSGGVSTPMKTLNSLGLGGSSSQYSPNPPLSSSLSNTFKIITPKKTFIVCAPSEEEEIKWLSALQALIARRVEEGRTSQSAAVSAVLERPLIAATSVQPAAVGSSGGGEKVSPTRGNAGVGLSGGTSERRLSTTTFIPTIHEQPPSPPHSTISPLSPPLSSPLVPTDSRSTSISSSSPGYSSSSGSPPNTPIATNRTSPPIASSSTRNSRPSSSSTITAGNIGSFGQAHQPSPPQQQVAVPPPVVSPYLPSIETTMGKVSQQQHSHHHPPTLPPINTFVNNAPLSNMMSSPISSSPETPLAMHTPESSSTSSGSTSSAGRRERSMTAAGKEAVEQVRRRFHPTE